MSKIKLEGKESDVREEERVKENNVMVREEGKQTGRQVKGGENEMRRGEGLKVKGEKKKKREERRKREGETENGVNEMRKGEEESEEGEQGLRVEGEEEKERKKGGRQGRGNHPK